MAELREDAAVSREQLVKHKKKAAKVQMTLLTKQNLGLEVGESGPCKGVGEQIC